MLGLQIDSRSKFYVHIFDKTKMNLKLEFNSIFAEKQFQMIFTNNSIGMKSKDS